MRPETVLRLRLPALALAAALATASQARGDKGFADLESPAHAYWTRPLQDRFTRIQDDLAAGRLPLDYSSEKAYVGSLLQALEIPASSQMLLYSTTSLQLSLISPRNPRALFFNDDLYLGWIPGGKIEIVSIDPELGGIFYIFDIHLDGRPPAPERSKRCMNCHSNEDTRQVPGVVIRSVVPGQRGGSLDAFRRGDAGHHIPLSQRFGGWHVTGAEGFEDHWGNLIGQFQDGEIVRQPLEPGRQFDWDAYLAPSSDILPQLVHEHQAGFANRMTETLYLARHAMHEGGGRLTNRVHIERLKQQADMLVAYLLFADEAALPPGGVAGDEAFAADFTRTRLADSRGRSLRDFNLKDRLFQHRCSYMIYSDAFRALPEPFKGHVYRRLGQALDPAASDPLSAHLSAAEKTAIREILRETLADLPPGW